MISKQKETSSMNHGKPGPGKAELTNADIDHVARVTAEDFADAVSAGGPLAMLSLPG